MMQVKIFVNNPWGENTILLYDETLETAVIDCGCLKESEQQRVSDFISSNGLKPVRLLNTHLHVDHVFGNQFMVDTYGLKPEASEEDDFLIAKSCDLEKMYGMKAMRGVKHPPATAHYLQDGDTVKFGNSTLKVIAIPGHSPGGLCYYSEPDKLLISGDVLFNGAIGRSDLPRGDGAALIRNIREKLFVLPDDVVVIPGHGDTTTIGDEKLYNPFF
ncbi:MAG: MBL fold metallo-hydrolase [Culturomica sp.]|jgi:glyoxylase-like metal-dependent hydrolase (beta-lactamase superfamily II)|nr:MBL fold metallo-hydrolase [Culturomica sp.]